MAAILHDIDFVSYCSFAGASDIDAHVGKEGECFPLPSFSLDVFVVGEAPIGNNAMGRRWSCSKVARANDVSIGKSGDLGIEVSVWVEYFESEESVLRSLTMTTIEDDNFAHTRGERLAKVFQIDRSSLEMLRVRVGKAEESFPSTF